MSEAVPFDEQLGAAVTQATAGAQLADEQWHNDREVVDRWIQEVRPAYPPTPPRQPARLPIGRYGAATLFMRRARVGLQSAFHRACLGPTVSTRCRPTSDRGTDRWDP